MADVVVSALEQKIEDLFEYRRFPEIYQMAKIESGQIKNLHNKLKSLQTSIYMLDKHLEENWELDEGVMRDCWQDIYTELGNFGIPSDQAPEYCAHIKRYEKHEKQLRQNILPFKYKMEYFYFYKSCDVKLQRRLIFEQLPQVKSLFRLSEWRWFDLITEINDDVEDVFEDLETINGNSFLIGLIFHGKKRTKARFEEFINTIESANENFDLHKSRWSERIYEMTKTNIALTRDLLHQNLDTFDAEDAGKSLLFKYLKQ